MQIYFNYEIVGEVRWDWRRKFAMNVFVMDAAADI